jgi:hypothetical protein
VNTVGRNVAHGAIGTKPSYRRVRSWVAIGW